MQVESIVLFIIFVNHLISLSSVVMKDMPLFLPFPKLSWYTWTSNPIHSFWSELIASLLVFIIIEAFDLGVIVYIFGIFCQPNCAKLELAYLFVVRSQIHSFCAYLVFNEIPFCICMLINGLCHSLVDAAIYSWWYWNTFELRIWLCWPSKSFRIRLIVHKIVKGFLYLYLSANYTKHFWSGI